MKAPTGPSGVAPNAPQLPRRQLGKDRKPGGKKPRKAASVGSSPAWTDSPCYHTHPRRSPRLTPLHNALARTTLSPGAALSSAPSMWKQRGGSAVPAAAPFAEAAWAAAHLELERGGGVGAGAGRAARAALPRARPGARGHRAAPPRRAPVGRRPVDPSALDGADADAVDAPLGEFDVALRLGHLQGVRERRGGVAPRGSK